LNPESLFVLVHSDQTFPTHILDELGEGDPFGRVHVDVMFVLDILVVDGVGADSLGVVPESRARVGQREV
jgi:hypothetical protein